MKRLAINTSIHSRMVFNLRNSKSRTYTEPVANIAIIDNFFFFGRCSDQREGIGRIKIAMSVTALKTPPDT